MRGMVACAGRRSAGFPGTGRYGYDLPTRISPLPRMPSKPVLDADAVALLQLGCSINAGAVGLDGMPTAARCCGCRVAPDRSSLTLFLSKTQGARVLRAVTENSAIAVVFSQPTTHRTLQIKGRDAVIVTPSADDLRLVAEYRGAFARELTAFGYEESIAYTVLSHPASDIAALRFTPAEVYLQTPGPKAGERIA